MIQLFQLLIIYLFLNALSAQKCQSDKNCITTFRLVENNCTLSLLSHQSIDSKTPHPQSNVFQHIAHGEFKYPQCYISSRSKSKKTQSGELSVTCFCLEKFSAACMSLTMMAESLYQWKRDPSSKDNDGIDDSEYKDKVDCVLKGFEKIQGSLAVSQPKELNWKVKCDPLKIEVETSGSYKWIKRLPNKTRLAIDLTCSNDLSPKIYCSEDYCHEGIDEIKDQLIPLRAYSLLYKSLNNGKLVARCGKRNPSNRKSDTQCILSAFHQLTNNAYFSNGTKKETPTMPKIGASKQKYKLHQSLDPTTSKNHIFSWFFMVLYIGPFFFTCFVSLCHFEHGLRNELGLIANSTLKDIEDTLVTEMRKYEESNTPAEKENKQKSEIIDLAVTTTTSQMGHITDLGSEGPTGPSGGSDGQPGPAAAAGSIKSVKKDSTALKSIEDTKDVIGDSAV